MFESHVHDWKLIDKTVFKSALEDFLSSRAGKNQNDPFDANGTNLFTKTVIFVFKCECGSVDIQKKQNI